MRAVVTGATGLLGANLAAELLAHGHDVVCTRRKTSRTGHLDDLDVEWVEANLTDLPALIDAFDTADAVFHCAALVQLRRKPTAALDRANVAGTINVLNACRRAGVGRLVHCSSVEAVGVADGPAPADETTSWSGDDRAANGYAWSKRRALMAVRDAAARDVDAVVVSPTVMLGPRDSRPSSGELIMRVLRGQAIAYPSGGNNFVDVRDVARGMRLAWEHGERGRSYILGAHNRSFQDIMTLIAELAQAPLPRIRLPRRLTSLFGLCGEIVQTAFDREMTINVSVARYLNHPGYRYSIDRARDELGYAPGPIEPAILDALRWFDEADMLPRRYRGAFSTSG